MSNCCPPVTGVQYPNRYQTVPVENEPYYWHRNKSFWSFIVPLGVDTVNLVQNPSFERNIDGWGSNLLPASVYSQSSDCAYSGAFSLKAEPAVTGSMYDANYGSLGGWPSPYAPQNVPFGETYYAKVAIKACRGDTLLVRFGQQGLASPFLGFIAGQTHEVQATGGWQIIEMQYRSVPPFMGAPAPGDPGRPVGIHIDNDNGSGCDEMHVDAAIISSEDTAFFDGGTDGATWDAAPHNSGSTASRFATTFGPKVNLTDLGFDIYGDTGWGHYPVEPVIDSNARLEGAHVQRIKPLPRTVSITGSWSCSPDEIHRQRCEFFSKLKYRFSKQCNYEFILCYQLTDTCGNVISEPLQIPVNYTAGGEGIRNDLHLDRATLQFTAYRQMRFCEPNQTSMLIDPNGITTVHNPGNEDAYLEVEWIAGTADITINNLVSFETNVQVTPGGMNLPAGNFAILKTDPSNQSFLEYPGEIDRLSNIFYDVSQIGLMRLVPGDNQIVSDVPNPNAETRVILTWRSCYDSADCVNLTGQWC